MIPEWLAQLSGRNGSDAERQLRIRVEQLEQQVEELSREKAGRQACDEQLKHLASFPEEYPNPILEITLSGQIKYLNPAARAVFPDILTRGTAHEVLLGLDSVAADMERKGTKSASREVPVGSLAFRQTIYYLPETGLLRIYVKDVTEQRKVEKVLRETEERLAVITANMMDMVVMTDVAAVYQYVSPSSKKITGFAPEEMVGKPAFYFIHPGDIMRVAEAIQEHLRTGEPGKIELRTRHADGHYTWIEAYGDLLRNEDGRIIGAVLTGRDIDDRKSAEDQLKKLVQEKEMLLKEVHHRAKNNMQVIASLLNLQSAHITDDRYLKIFQDSQNRIRSMSLVHEKLYRASAGSRIDFGEYLRSLADNLYYSYGVSPDKVSLRISAEDVFLDTDTAITCGLLVTEMISNALKHAFPGGIKGHLWAEMRPEGDGYVLIAGDDGVGLPEGIDPENTGTLGMQLISSLVSQLSGTLEIGQGKGTQYTVRFKAGKE